MLRARTKKLLGMLALAVVLSNGAAGSEEPWVTVLRQALDSERRCRLEKVLWQRQITVGEGTALEGRARCSDGREFDFARPRPHMRFVLRLCEPTLC